jgi:hypothetical protein
MRLLEPVRRSLRVLLVMAGAACAAAERDEYVPCADGASSDTAITDSAGVPVHVSGCLTTVRSIGWVVDSVPDLELGDDRADGHTFDGIRGISGLPGTRVAVLDRGSRELRYFSPQGNLLTRLGRKGKGPGEFEEPFMVRAPLSDSLLVFDNDLRRFTSFPVDGQGESHVRVATNPWLHRIRTPWGAVGGRMLLEDIVLDLNEIIKLGLYRQTLTVLWAGEPEGTDTVLATWPVDRLYIVQPEGRLRHSRVVPFSSYPSAAPTRTGAFVTDGNRFEILDFDTAGRLTRVLRVDRKRQLVTAHDLRLLREYEIESGRRTARSWEMFSGLPLPDSMPAFTALQVDRLGWLWAQLFTWDARQPTTWLVFDPTGQGRGTVQLPPGLEVHDIGEDYVLGMWKNEVGVEHVRRYRLTRLQPVASVEPALSVDRQ